MLEVKDLHCSYGTTQVLKGVDITVNKGEVISILGSSGSGKTTLLRCISFLQKADSGTIRFDDFEKDITKLKHSEVRALRMKMGYVFQNFNLFRNMTVKQNVLEGLITARGVDRATAEKTADEVLEKVGMLHRKDFYPDQLSGGQQQRVAIARAIAFRPEVLLFDEPTSALDPELTRGAEHHHPVGRRRPDAGRRHPRDGLCPQRFRPHYLYGKRRCSRGSPRKRIFPAPQAGGKQALFAYRD